MFGHLMVTLTTGTATQASATHLAVKWFGITGTGAATAYLGGPTVTSSDYGYALTATGAYECGFSPTCFDLSTLWIDGTTGNVVHILYVLA